MGRRQEGGRRLRRKQMHRGDPPWLNEDVSAESMSVDKVVQKAALHLGEVPPGASASSLYVPTGMSESGLSSRSSPMTSIGRPFGRVSAAWQAPLDPLTRLAVGAEVATHIEPLSAWANSQAGPELLKLAEMAAPHVVIDATKPGPLHHAITE